MFTCTQRNLVIHIPASMINTSIPVSKHCFLFAQVPVTVAILKSEKNETTVAYKLSIFSFSLVKDKTFFFLQKKASSSIQR